MISVLATILMTRANLGPKMAKAGAWGIVIALAALALWWAYSWAYGNGRDDERARWGAASAKVIAADVKADTVALDTAATTKGQIDDGNERAKQAASGSDDPLAAGFDSLRKENPRGGGQAPR